MIHKLWIINLLAQPGPWTSHASIRAAAFGVCEAVASFWTIVTKHSPSTVISSEEVNSFAAFFAVHVYEPASLYWIRLKVWLDPPASDWSSLVHENCGSGLPSALQIIVTSSPYVYWSAMSVIGSSKSLILIKHNKYNKIILINL